jgi:hypothetical protein
VEGARRGRASCSGREFAYFGQAFVRDALARTASLVETFDIARGLISAQEAAEGLPASAPQIALGSAIAELLKGR